MAGIRWPPEEQDRQGDADAHSHYSDDDRSLAADSWSVKSDYGSTLDGDDLRQSEASEALAAANLRHSDYSSDKEEADGDFEHSMLGLQSHWDTTYAEELANFHEHGDTGEIWFGEGVMETMASWTARICLALSSGFSSASENILAHAGRGHGDVASSGNPTLGLAVWSVLDIGTGNGVLLHALTKQGFSDLTGSDFSDGAVELAKAVAAREGHNNIRFVVDDVLDTKLERKYKLITDKGTLDAVGLHPDGKSHKILYWKSVMKLLEVGGVFVTSCNNTKDELVEEVNAFNQTFRVGGTTSNKAKESNTSGVNSSSPAVDDVPSLEYIDHVRTYPVFRFGGREGSQVCTVAFLKR